MRKAGPSWPSAWPPQRSPSSGAGVTVRCSTTATPSPICTSRAASSIPARLASRNSARCGCRSRTFFFIPFVQNYSWWATGIAGVVPSALAYLASCAGIYRLARNWLSPAPAALALVFFALNPNLLYLQTTAMTEPLFLCEFIWIVVWLVEWRAALDEETAAAGSNPHSAPSAPRSSIARTTRLQICIAIALVAAIFTRYDGWIIALIAWSGVGIHAAPSRCCRAIARASLRRPSGLPPSQSPPRQSSGSSYNSVCFGDWLYFARGPYSAHAIELRTAANAPGWPPHPGWHNPGSRSSSISKSLSSTPLPRPVGAISGAIWFWRLAALGTARAWLVEKTRRRAIAWTLLLWLPVPFYAWSVAYGSVPIFFPAWWPFTWYNTRYGLELLPALALGLGFAAQYCRYRSGHAAARALVPQRVRDSVPTPTSPSRSSLLSPASTSSRSCAPAPSSTLKAPRTPTRASPTTIPFLRPCSRCSSSTRTPPCS